MNIQLKQAKLKRVIIFLAGISTASIPAMVHADWSIIGLGSLGGSFGEAWSLNDFGQVVGTSSIANDETHAFMTGPNGVGMSDLHGLVEGGRSSSLATDINDSGQAVGRVGGHAFITDSNGIGMTKLGTLGGSETLAYSVNNSGQVVGSSTTANGDIYPFITGPNGVGMTELSSLGMGIAWGINDSGQVVGETGGGHAFITGPNGVNMTLLALAGR